MSQNPIRRSVALHTYEAAINFGQMNTLPHDGAPPAPQPQSVHAFWHPAPAEDGLTDLFPANDDSGIGLVDLPGLTTDRAEGAHDAAFPLVETQSADAEHAARDFSVLIDLMSDGALIDPDSEQDPATVETTPALPAATDLHETSTRAAAAGLALADVLAAEDPLGGVLEDALLPLPGFVPGVPGLPPALEMPQDPVRNVDHDTPRGETLPWLSYRPDPFGADIAPDA